jgi:hypothetical protein
MNVLQIQKVSFVSFGGITPGAHGRTVAGIITSSSHETGFITGHIIKSNYEIYRPVTSTAG